MKVNQVLCSLDLWAALVLAAVFAAFLGPWVPNEFAKDIYSIGISVLSIVFSVYFAALAIIISASDDDFVAFLEETGDYSPIIATFRFSLVLLFVALMYSLLLYARTSYRLVGKIEFQSRWFLLVFAVLFFYSLFAVVNSTMDAITYSKFRSRFVTLKKNRQRSNSASPNASPDVTPKSIG